MPTGSASSGDTLNKQTGKGTAKKKRTVNTKRPSAGPASKSTTKKAIKKKAVAKTASTKKAGKKKAVKEAGDGAPARAQSAADFLIVGVGASAGGLEALEKLVSNVENTQNVAFIVIQHLSPKYKSTMDKLLQPRTKLNILQATDRTAVKPGCMYLNPPDRDVFLKGGRLLLKKPIESRGHRSPIDAFFKSLAADQQERAVCVILSGTGSDGTLGLRAVKDSGGMVLVQDASQAKYDGMPQNAIATGLVDQVLPVEKIPALLDQVVAHPYHAKPLTEEQSEKKDLDHVREVLELVYHKTGQDFSAYKRNTIHRRIHRRMALCQIHKLGDYVRYLKKSSREIETLSNDLLIGVTSFFRDPKAFNVLKAKALAALVKTKKDRDKIRVWVPGSATGEEAYSIAMLLAETMAKAKKDIPVQIFATDMSNASIDIARRGAYPAAISADVSPERLKAFFRNTDDRYIINKGIREMVIFSKHNVTQDPPFSKMDLVCCRNLLIYFNTTLQKNVLQLFRYALNEGGYLFLGVSETPGELSGDFSVISSKYKLFKRKKGDLSAKGVQHMPSFSPSYDITELAPAKETGRPVNISEVATQILLEEHSPSYALINEQLQVLYLQGDTSPYLILPPGEPSYNILDLVRGDIRNELTTMVHKAVRQKKALESGVMKIATEGRLKSFSIVVRPLPRQENIHDLFMVIFQEKTVDKGARKKKKADPKYEVIELELKSTKEYIRNLREEFDTTSEDLTSANEELQSSNEELQSTNEELETSKEELQSVNEELESTNSELRSTVDELERAHDDISNLMASTDVGTIFLDTELHITRFTPRATAMFNLIEADIGRPIADMTLHARYDTFIDDLNKVLADLLPREAEIMTNDGKWMSVRMTPYRSLANRIEGVVVSFIDVNRLKQAEMKAHDAGTFADGIINTTRQPLLVLDDQLNVVRANRAFHETFRTRLRDTVGRRIYELGNNQFDNPELMSMLEEVLPKDKNVYDHRVTLELKELGRRDLLINASRLRVEEKGTRSILLAIEDVTERNRMMEQLGDANRKLEVLMQEMNHRIKNNLVIVQTLLKLQARDVADNESKEMFRKSQARVQSISLIHNILYHTTDQSSVEFGGYVDKLMKELTNIYDIDPSRIRIDIDIPVIDIDLNNIPPLGLLVTELVTNAFKYAFPDGRKGLVSVTLQKENGDGFVLSIRDDGVGIQKEFDIEKSDSFGMEIVKALIGQIHGKLQVIRDRGTEFRITFTEEWVQS